MILRVEACESMFRYPTFGITVNIPITQPVVLVGFFIKTSQFGLDFQAFFEHWLLRNTLALKHTACL